MKIMPLSKEISQPAIVEMVIGFCKLGFKHSNGHHYGYTKEQIEHFVSEILMICGLDRECTSQGAESRGKGDELFREFAMRAQYFFPETEQDLEWFDGNIEDKRHMLKEVAEYLGLGKLNEDEIIK